MLPDPEFSVPAAMRAFAASSTLSSGFYLRDDTSRWSNARAVLGTAAKACWNGRKYQKFLPLRDSECPIGVVKTGTGCHGPLTVGR
jgi:hypothetical protein